MRARPSKDGPRPNEDRADLGDKLRRQVDAAKDETKQGVGYTGPSARTRGARGPIGRRTQGAGKDHPIGSTYGGLRGTEADAEQDGASQDGAQPEPDKSSCST